MACVYIHSAHAFKLPYGSACPALALVTAAHDSCVFRVGTWVTLFDRKEADFLAASNLSMCRRQLLILQVADGLHFLHTQANQIHRGISPEAMCITAGGAWKLAGFGFAMLAEFGNSNPAEAAFDYSDSSNSLAAQALKVHCYMLHMTCGHTNGLYV